MKSARRTVFVFCFQPSAALSGRINVICNEGKRFCFRFPSN